MRIPFLTLAMIAACILVALLSSFGAATDSLTKLYIAFPGSLGLDDVVAGEVWRLVTPIFIHFGFFHLLFNMVWLWDLGRMVELRRGPWFFGGFVVVTAVIGNIAEFLAAGPFFGGMSGIVYGLLSYIWLRNRLAGDGYVLHRFDVVTALAWYVLCWTGLVGPIANVSHTAGLIAGLAWAYLEPRAVNQSDKAQPGSTRRRTALAWIGTLGVGLVMIIVSTQLWLEWKACANRLNASPDRRIAICSKFEAASWLDSEMRANALIGRGDAYRANGTYELAGNDYDEAIKLAPQNAAAFAGRALVERAAGRIAESRADLDHAYRIDPEIEKLYPAILYWRMVDETLAGIDLKDAGAVDHAMREVVRQLLQTMPPSTPDDMEPSARVISFRTDTKAVIVPPRLRALHPTQMTLWLQYEYRDLKVTPQTLKVTVSFDGVSETVTVPLEMISAFWDQTAGFSIVLKNFVPG